MPKPDKPIQRIHYGSSFRENNLTCDHQVDFLPAFDMVLLMSDGEILRSASYDQLLGYSSKEFQDLVNAHKEIAGSERVSEAFYLPRSDACSREIQNKDSGKPPKTCGGDQLIKQEEREIGDTGFKPYVQYLNQNKGYLFFAIAVLSQLAFLIGQILPNSWKAANVKNSKISINRSFGFTIIKVIVLTATKFSLSCTYVVL